MRCSSALWASCCWRLCSSSRPCVCRASSSCCACARRRCSVDLVRATFAHVSLSCALGAFLLKIENFRRGGIQLGLQRRASLVAGLGRAAIVTGMGGPVFPLHLGRDRPLFGFGFTIDALVGKAAVIDARRVAVLSRGGD